MPTKRKRQIVPPSFTKEQFNKVNKLGAGFNLFHAWLNSNIIPVVSWLVMLGLAVVGLMQVIQALSHDARVAVAIFVVAFLATTFKR